LNFYRLKSLIMTKSFIFFCLIILTILGSSPMNAQTTLVPFVKGNKYGYKDGTGKVVIKSKYEKANPFIEGFASVKFNKKWGFIDSKGKEITTFKYDDNDSVVYHFSEGRAAVRAEKWGYIDTSGIEVIDLKYSTAEDFINGKARVHQGKSVSKLIDKEGKTIHQKTYDHVYTFKGNRARVTLGNKCGYIDHSGTEIIPVIYSLGTDFDEGIAIVYKDNKAGAIDTNGNMVIPFNYTYLRGFDEGSAVAANDSGLYGYIDRTGQVILPFKYQLALPMHSGIAMVAKDNLWAFVDNTGRNITPFKYHIKTSEYDFVGPQYSEGFEPVMIGNFYGYVEVTTGKELTPFKYDNAESFKNGKAVIRIWEKRGYLDISGVEHWISQ
jgi:hypothetical protein